MSMTKRKSSGGIEGIVTAYGTRYETRREFKTARMEMKRQRQKERRLLQLRQFDRFVEHRDPEKPCEHRFTYQSPEGKTCASCRAVVE